ncbi:MAG TPA: hypothetical protein VF156_15595 [Agromyces sp.]
MGKSYRGVSRDRHRQTKQGSKRRGRDQQHEPLDEQKLMQSLQRQQRHRPGGGVRRGR